MPSCSNASRFATAAAQAERVARVGVAVEEGPELLVGAQEALVDPLGGKRGRERHVAAGQSLRHAHDVGRDPLLFAGEHRPGPPEAGCDLVADQEDIVAVAELANAAQETGRLHADPRRSLDERLDDDCGDLPVVEVEDALELRGVAGCDVVGVEEERAVALVEEIDPADRHRSDRVAVVGVAQADVRLTLRLSLLLEVLEGHLERDLSRGRSRVRIEHTVEAGRRDLHEALGQLGGERMGEAQHRGVGDAIELVADRLVDTGMAMPVDVAPER